MIKKYILLIGLFAFLFFSVSACAGDGDVYYFMDSDVRFDVTQLGIIIQLFLFVIFVWISFKITSSSELKGGGSFAWHFAPFSGGLFLLFASFDFLGMVALLQTYLTGSLIIGQLYFVGIILLVYSFLKTFYYRETS